MGQPNETKKEVNRLYFRELTDTEKEHIAKLMKRFKATTALSAAKKALFGYMDLEQSYMKLKEEIRAVRSELANKEKEHNKFAANVHLYLSTQEKVKEIRTNLIDTLKQNTNSDERKH